MEDYASELVPFDSSLSKSVEILEVFSETKSIQFCCLAQFLQDILNIFWNWSRLTSSSFYLILDNRHIGKIKGLGVFEELKVAHLGLVFIIRGI